VKRWVDGRPVRTLLCPECGRPFQARAWNSRYCGRPCTMKAWRAASMLAGTHGFSGTGHQFRRLTPEVARPPRWAIWQAMRESEWLAQVIRWARRGGWQHYHTYRSNRSPTGFPDLVLLHPRRIQKLVAELKTESGTTTPAQDAWLEAFRLVGVPAYVWRPHDEDEVKQFLLEDRA